MMDEELDFEMRYSESGLHIPVYPQLVEAGAAKFFEKLLRHISGTGGIYSYEFSPNGKLMIVRDGSSQTIHRTIMSPAIVCQRFQAGFAGAGIKFPGLEFTKFDIPTFEAVKKQIEVSRANERFSFSRLWNRRPDIDTAARAEHKIQFDEAIQQSEQHDRNQQELLAKVIAEEFGRNPSAFPRALEKFGAIEPRPQTERKKRPDIQLIRVISQNEKLGGLTRDQLEDSAVFMWREASMDEAAIDEYLKKLLDDSTDGSSI